MSMSMVYMSMLMVFMSYLEKDKSQIVLQFDTCFSRLKSLIHLKNRITWILKMLIVISRLPFSQILVLNKKTKTKSPVMLLPTLLDLFVITMLLLRGSCLQKTYCLGNEPKSRCLLAIPHENVCFFELERVIQVQSLRLCMIECVFLYYGCLQIFNLPTRPNFQEMMDGLLCFMKGKHQ